MCEVTDRIAKNEALSDMRIRAIRITLVISMCFYFSASICIGGFYG